MQNASESTSRAAYALIEQTYREMRLQVRAYIFKRINNADDADDLTHDTFLRLLEYGQTIRTETVSSMLFTVARNLVFDYLRRQYCHQEVHDEIMQGTDPSSNYSESLVLADDLEQMESKFVGQLPTQRQRIYRMVRYEDRSVSEISDMLQLSVRTVENHLLMGRHQVREKMRKCM